VKGVGATKAGLDYILSKCILQTSTALNVCMYLTLKAEQASTASDDNEGSFSLGNDDSTTDVKSHPVILRLNQLNGLLEKLEEQVEAKVDGLPEQMTNLVKAAALMTSEEIEEGDDSTSSSEIEGDGDMMSDDEDEEMDEMKALEKMKAKSRPIESDSDNDAGSSSEEEDEEVIQRNVMNEARFAVRASDVTDKSSRTRRAAPTDFGDEEDEHATTKASKALAITLNSISQRSATVESRKNRGVAAVEEVDDNDEDDNRFQRGLDMMEAELGVLGSDNPNEKGAKEDDDSDDELNDDDEMDGGFYASIKKKSIAKKEFKKTMYAVAPKYPGMEAEVEGMYFIFSMSILYYCTVTYLSNQPIHFSVFLTL
jgi:U3 small nucleolar RNA-associated protein 3